MAAVCTACCAAALTACSDDTNDAGRLPAGQYPITLTATVEGQTVTRATSDNTWAGTEEVALQVGGEVKKYTVAADGALTADNNDVQYWTAKTMTVQAWHSPQGYSATRPTEFTVKADQNTNNGEGFQQSDLLYTSQSITYNANTNASNPPQLTFRHLPVKVVVNLKADTQNGVTEADVTNATVTLVNQALTSGAITYNGNTGAASVAQAAAGNVITPKVNALAASGYHKTVQALLVPQQMQGKQFVKITIGSSIYYYTPKNDDANLEHGKQYTYNITVKKEKLEVTASSSVSWADDVTTEDAQKAVFHVTMPAGHNQALTPSTNATQSGDGYDVTGSSFTISYTVTTGDEFKGFPAVKGLCDFTRTSTTNGGTTTYTFTYSNVRSDLWLSYTEYAEVGDFYYDDGTWSAVKDDSKTCIGIVFKRGVDEKDAVSNYDDGTFTDNTIHGYAVALTDAGSNECTWGKRSDTPLNNVSDANNADYNGYGNTKKMIDTYQSNANWDTYAAFKAIVDYRVSITAPANSSNWYLPSLKQLADVYAVYQNAPGNVLYDRLNSISSGNLFKEAAVGQDGTRGGYWTSTEKNSTDAWYVRFADSSGAKEAYSKGESYIRNSFVRAILTF